MGRSWAAGRALCVQQAHWQVLLQGSKVGACARDPVRAPASKPVMGHWGRRAAASLGAWPWSAGGLELAVRVCVSAVLCAHLCEVPK